MKLALKVQELISFLVTELFQTKSENKPFNFKLLSEDDLLGKNCIKIDSAYDFEVNREKLNGLTIGSLINNFGY